MKKYEKEFADDATEAWYVVGKVFIAIFAVVTIVFLIWGDHLIHGKMKCAFYLLLHAYCPGCGCTRATYWLVHLHPWKSFLYIPVSSHKETRLYKTARHQTGLRRSDSADGAMGDTEYPVCRIRIDGFIAIFGKNLK